MAKYFHPSYSNFYVNDSGKIFNSKTDRELKGTVTKNGIRISIRPKGENPISIPTDKFVWEAYNNEETNNYFILIHKDGDKLNNKPDNLKRILNNSSYPDNQERKIVATNLSTGETKMFDSIYKASKVLKVNPSSISLIAERKRKTATSKQNNNKYSFKYQNPHDLNSVKIIKNMMNRQIENGRLKL